MVGQVSVEEYGLCREHSKILCMHSGCVVCSSYSWGPRHIPVYISTMHVLWQWLIFYYTTIITISNYIVTYSWRFGQS